MSLSWQRGDARQRAGEQEKKQMFTKRKIVFCPIVFGRSSLGDLYVFFTKGRRKKQDGVNIAVLLEALAGRFICFGESDVPPRHFQRGRIRGGVIAKC